jgi:hypothetical protein
MDSGKATSESIQTQINMVDQANGKNVATQNVGLYNLYKKRSYQCQVVCLGNALLQPTMYFNLRHVPMFNGPYLITEVNHTIQPGQFQTNFTGIRQGIYDLPSIDSLNQNLLTQIESAILKKKENIPVKPETNINKTAQLQQAGDNAAAASNSCTLSLDTNYVTWGDFVESATTGLTEKQLADAIIAKTNDVNLQIIIYLMCYIKTFNTDKFYGYNNNFVNAELSVYWGTVGRNYFIQKQASCVSISNANGSYDNTKSSTPIANFANLDTFLDFMIARLGPNVNRILFGENGNAPLGVPKYYACYWTPATSENPNISPKYFDENQDEFKTLKETVIKGLKSANKAQLSGDANSDVKAANKAQEQQIANVGAGATNNLNTTTLPPPICLPPSITSFTPSIGVKGTIVNIIGNDLGSVTGITINGITVITGITINSETNVVVIVPFSNTTVPQNNVITVKSVYGDGSSTTTFTYNPLQTSAAPPTVAPNVLPNSNTQPQQTGPVTMTGITEVNTIYTPGYTKIGINTPLINDWEILSDPLSPYLSYEVVQTTVSSNNTTVQTVISQGVVNLMDAYTNSTFTEFYIEDGGVIYEINNNGGTIPTDCVINYKIKILANTITPTTPPTQSVTQWFSNVIIIP